MILTAGTILVALIGAIVPPMMDRNQPAPKTEITNEDAPPVAVIGGDWESNPVGATLKGNGAVTFSRTPTGGCVILLDRRNERGTEERWRFTFTWEDGSARSLEAPRHTGAYVISHENAQQHQLYHDLIEKIERTNLVFPDGEILGGPNGFAGMMTAIGCPDEQHRSMLRAATGTTGPRTP